MYTMKCSMSMSSLNAPGCGAGDKASGGGFLTPDSTPTKQNLQSTRLCSTLSSKKPRRTLERKMYRRTWGSTEDLNQEELLRVCLQSIQGLQGGPSDHELLIPIREFLENYSEVCEWLNILQNERSRCADSLSLSILAEELRKRQYVQEEMNEKVKYLIQKLPHLKEEFQWRIKHVNSQWDSLEQILNQSPSRNSNGKSSRDGTDPECGSDWVKSWIVEMENELHPLKFNIQWSPEEIVAELARYKALQTKIVEKSPLIHSAVRQCQSSAQGRSSSSATTNQQILPRHKKKLELLENRWIQLRLRVLEWIEHLSRLEQKREYTNQKDKNSKNGSFQYSKEQSDEELCGPLSKYPRLVGGNSAGGFHIDRRDSNCEYYFVYQESSPSMGQNCDAEIVYRTNSPLSQHPNSTNIIEFSYAGDGTVGNECLKRKIIRDPRRGFRTNESGPQVVSPVGTMNISTYYFKHSDTESEQTYSLPHDHESSEILSLSNHPDPSQKEEPLEFGQKEARFFEVDSQFLLHQSLGLDFELDDCDFVDGGEEIMEQEDSSLQNIEIEELVQNADLLVQNCIMASSSGFGRIEEAGSVEDSEPPVVNNSKVTVCKCATLPLAGGAVGGHCSICSSTMDSGSTSRISKKHTRVKQWVRNQNSGGPAATILPIPIVAELISEQKISSSCDASAESASESSSDLESEEGGGDPQVSSDDPTTVCASSTFPNLQSQTQSQQSLLSVNSQSEQSQSKQPSLVTLRSKKKNNFTKQRPKSFTDHFTSSHSQGGDNSHSHQAHHLSPIHDRKSLSSNYFISDTALNYLGHTQSGGSGGSSHGQPQGQEGQGNKEKRKSKLKKRLLKHRKRISLDLDDGGENLVFDEIEDPQASAQLQSNSKPSYFRLQSDNASVNTEELQMTNEQDWDSYQEKYLSEPYSEELFDQDRTLKLLAFGEDYDQVLDRADSECSSSMLSGFEPAATRRPLLLMTTNRGGLGAEMMPESDSDREEFNYFLTQSMSQLRFIDSVFRKQLSTSSNSLDSQNNSEFAEMEATCEENINSLKLILSNLEKPDGLSFEVDVQSIKEVLENWTRLRTKICQAAKHQQIKEEMVHLKSSFEDVQQYFENVDPFNSNDLNSLQFKIEQLQSMLTDFKNKKLKLQNLNEASLETQIFNKDSVTAEELKRKLQELYGLYEENFQLGSYLLSKMKTLEEAWTMFENEKSEFERSMTLPSLRPKPKNKDSSSAASTDSGHGTDFSHDSCVSDSDVDFQEKSQKLTALRKRASELKAFLPPGSPVLTAIDLKLDEAQRDFEAMKKLGLTPVNLKFIYPKKKSPSKKSSSKSISLKGNISLSSPRHESPSPKTTTTKKQPSRHWRMIRFSITFHLALMGLFAVAWILQPRCCENMNNYCFSLVPHLTHDRIPRI